MQLGIDFLLDEYNAQSIPNFPRHSAHDPLFPPQCLTKMLNSINSRGTKEQREDGIKKLEPRLCTKRAEFALFNKEPACCLQTCLSFVWYVM